MAVHRWNGLKTSPPAIVIAIVVLAFVSAPRVCLGTDLQLRIEAHPDRLDFRLDGASNSTP